MTEQKQYRTIDLYDKGIKDINRLLRENCNEGWEFLGFGSTMISRSYGGDYLLYFASFCNSDLQAYFYE